VASSLGTSDCCENLECRCRNDVGWKVVATTFHPMSLLHRHSWFSDSVSKHSYFPIYTQASSLYLHFLTASVCTFYHKYATRILVCVIAVACKFIREFFIESSLTFYIFLSTMTPPSSRGCVIIFSTTIQGLKVDVFSTTSDTTLCISLENIHIVQFCISVICF